MKRNQRQGKCYFALCDIIGVTNTAKLSQMYGGKHLYIPNISKYDKRLPLIKSFEYMSDILDYGVEIQVLLEEKQITTEDEKKLKGFVKYCQNRSIRTFESFISSLNLFRGAGAEQLLILIGSVAFVRLVEAYSGNDIYIPLRGEIKASVKEKYSKNDCDILFALLDGLSVDDTAARFKVSKATVKAISNNYITC